MTATTGWSTDAGLRVGAPIFEIARLYPGLHLPFVEGDDWALYALVPRTFAPDGTALRVETHAGRVDSIMLLASMTFIYQSDR